MNKLLLWLLAFLLCCCSTGCNVEHNDINELSIVMGAVFEYLPEQQMYEVHAQVAKPSAFTKSQGGGGAEEGFIFYRGRGKSIMEAIREANRKANYRLFWSHCDVYVVDRKLAQHGLFPFLDFMNRDNEIRETANIFVTEVPAHDLLKMVDGNEKVPLMGLRKTARLGEQSTGSSFAVQMIDVLRDIVMRNSFALAPLVKGEVGIGEKEQQKKFLLAGMAVFNKDKMVGTLTPAETRGYMFVKNKLENTVVVTRAHGRQMTLEVVKTTGKIIPQYQEGNLAIKVEIDAVFNYAEIDAPLDLTDLSLATEVESALAEEIRKEITAVVAKSQDLQVDFFDFARDFQKAYPQMWKTLQKDWSREVYPDTQIEVQINATLLRSGLLIHTDIGG